MSLNPQTFEEAKSTFKPLKRSDMARGKGLARKTSPARRKARKRPKRKKVTSRKSLIKKIDGLVFEFVCLRDGRCVECGSVAQPTTGHVLSRRSMATRWDERNVHLQCWRDNYRAAMTGAASYHLWYVKKFGVDSFEELYRDWTRGRKYTRLELESVLITWQEKVATLKRRKEFLDEHSLS